jgi:hypothetical protein
MPVTINGTTGIVGPDGSASTPAIQGSDNNTGMFFPAADTVAIATGGTERVRTDSSGNVGIGVTPSAWEAGQRALDFGISGTLKSNTATGSVVSLGNNCYYGSASWRYKNSSQAVALYDLRDTGEHRWYYAASGTAGNAITFTQAMTLDSSGNLLVGTTSQISSGKVVLSYSGQVNNGIVYNDTYATSTTSPCIFRRNSTQVGSIDTTPTATSYLTSSDYRLKADIQAMTGALAKVAALKPVTYKWKADGSDGQGFIAHELAEVCPDAVSGEKDAVDSEGNPVYQGIDTSFLVATLTAAIQELKAELDSVKAELATLKNG